MTRRVAVVALALALIAGCAGGSSARAPQSGSASVAEPSTSAASATGVPEQTPYADRLAMAQRLASRYPGTSDPEPTLGRFGFWAGILVQTGWQQSSHRDRVPSWNLMNSSLSVLPSSYATDYESRSGSFEDRCASDAFVQADPDPGTTDLPDRSTACQDWMRYFDAVQQRRPGADLDRLMWEAHTQSLVLMLKEHPKVLDDSSTVEEENFLSSWFEIVLALAALEFPTLATTSVPARETVMPDCSPIGADGCALTQADLGTAYDFASTLAKHPVSADKILSLYRLGRSNAPALLASVGSDLSITSALQDYLAAAGWSPSGLLPFPIPTLPTISIPN